ncbi:hypothetical protein [Streptomyces sp. NPDC058623]|uniref:hypothetical protein n=1 Tax=Streptomyces sp. NPDC058623 TaxID=3346563 RepID=UPI00364F70D1
MPGQHRRRERARRRVEAWSAAHMTGRWNHVFSTEDRRELRTYLDELTRTGTVRAEDVRVDVLCGRPAHTTHYQVSVRTPEPEA